MLIQMGRLTNLIFNLQFQIPSLLQSVLTFLISDFAFLRVYTLLICWEKLFNFLNSCGPPGVRGPHVKNRWSILYGFSNKEKEFLHNKKWREGNETRRWSN
jgi:hypothetical protein